jgi:ribonuclease BN (tRNA processing enzyme)
MHLASTELEIFGAGNDVSDLSNNLSRLVFGKTFPLDLGDIACKLDIHNLSDECGILLKTGEKPQIITDPKFVPSIEDVWITFYKSYVHPQDGVMIYKIAYDGRSVVYATDKECYFGGDKKFVQFAKNCDLLIHDTQYTSEDYLNPSSPKQGYGHSTYDMAIEVMKQTNAKTLACFHYDPGYDDEKLNRIKEYYTTTYPNVKLPYEGYETEV